MIDIRPFRTLGNANHGWLNARHHFSFANYYDPSRMSWGAIRVWNDDEIAARSGFPPHPHSDMEIITYVREGAITHQDSMGNQGRTEAGDVQVMSAGTGITHAEYNVEDEPTTLFRSGSCPTSAASGRRGAAARFPRTVERDGSSRLLPGSTATKTRCGSAPMRGWRARRSRPARRWIIRLGLTAGPIWCPQPARWKSRACA